MLLLLHSVLVLLGVAGVIISAPCVVAYGFLTFILGSREVQLILAASTLALICSLTLVRCG